MPEPTPKRRIAKAMTTGVALATIYIGIDGMMGGEKTLVLILSLVLGGMIGTLLNLDQHLENLGKKVESRFKNNKNGNIAEGFISLPGGIRVGVCGSAAYDGEKLVGISNMSSLLFRIPTGECAFEDELYAVFCEGIGRGMIIYSPPGVGKTTAIRRLAYMIGGGNSPKRVAVVDERGEFDENDYFDRRVDILRGYKKGIGIEIATRTMSPDLITIDEIGADDVEPMLSAIKCGVPIIATAHAADKYELLSRPALRRFFDCSAFDKLVGIRVENGKYILSVDSL